MYADTYLLCGFYTAVAVALDTMQTGGGPPRPRPPHTPHPTPHPPGQGTMAHLRARARRRGGHGRGDGDRPDPRRNAAGARARRRCRGLPPRAAAPPGGRPARVREGARRSLCFKPKAAESPPLPPPRLPGGGRADAAEGEAGRVWPPAVKGWQGGGKSCFNPGYIKNTAREKMDPPPPGHRRHLRAGVGHEHRPLQRPRARGVGQGRGLLLQGGCVPLVSCVDYSFAVLCFCFK